MEERAKKGEGREAMNRIKLLEPTKEYKEQVMAYREALFRNHDSFDGCAGCWKMR